MRILQITSDYLPKPLWGMGWHVNQVVNGLSKYPEHEVYIATAHKSLNEGDNIIYTDLDIDKKLLSNNEYEIFNNYNNFNKWQIALAEEVIREGLEFDIIHAHNWMSWLTAKEVKKHYPNAKLFVTFHLLQKQYELMKENPIPSSHSEIISIEQEAINLSDGIIVLSDSQVNLIKSKYKIDKNKIYLIPHSVNFEMIDYSELKKIKEENTTMKIVFLGRIEEDKGIREVINVFNLLKRKYKISLDIIGDGPILDELIKKCKNDDIKFWGYQNRDKIKEILMKSNIFCLPSSSENLPLTLLEAMAFGVVPVFTKGPSVPNIYKDGKEGKLVNLVSVDKKLVPDNSQLISIMEDLLRNPEKVKRMSKESYNLILKSYSIDNMINSLLNLYNRN